MMPRHEKGRKSWLRPLTDEAGERQRMRACARYLAWLLSSISPCTSHVRNFPKLKSVQNENCLRFFFHPFKMSCRGQWDYSAGKGSCFLAWRPIPSPGILLGEKCLLRVGLWPPWAHMACMTPLPHTQTKNVSKCKYKLKVVQSGILTILSSLPSLGMDKERMTEYRSFVLISMRWAPASPDTVSSLMSTHLSLSSSPGLLDHAVCTPNSLLESYSTALRNTHLSLGQRLIFKPCL